MQDKKPFLLRFIQPIKLEPVIGAIRITVKPKLWAIHRTSASRLVDKAFWHQGNLIEKNAGQRDSLNQVLAAFILAAEDVEVIGSRSPADFYHIVSSMVLHVVSTAPKHQLQPKQDISPEAANGLTAHGEVLAAEPIHRPEHEW